MIKLVDCNVAFTVITQYGSTVYTSKFKILQIIMWNIGMAQKAKETRSGSLVHIVQ